MSEETRKTAGWLIVILPTVVYGGISLLNFIVTNNSGYVDNPLRQGLFRAGHAHAGVLLLLSLISFLYVDQTALSNTLKRVVRFCIPSSAIFVPFGFFFSVLMPDATEVNNFIFVSYFGALVLVTGLLVLGIGLIRKRS